MAQRNNRNNFSDGNLGRFGPKGTVLAAAVFLGSLGTYGYEISLAAQRSESAATIVSMAWIAPSFLILIYGSEVCQGLIILTQAAAGIFANLTTGLRTLVTWSERLKRSLAEGIE